MAVGFDPRSAKEIFSEFDVFVFPSLWEGLPYSIVEAIFNNKVIISSKVGGIGEVLLDRHNSLLLEEVTVENINNVIDIIFENKSLFEYLKSYKFNNEQRMFDYGQMEHKVLNVFHKFVDNN
jgi:glycosyltransferase involved in cell wall biosynthesis